MIGFGFIKYQAFILIAINAQRVTINNKTNLYFCRWKYFKTIDYKMTICIK